MDPPSCFDKLQSVSAVDADRSETSDPAAIRRAAMDLLARREHSGGELLRKLKRRFDDAGLIGEVLEALGTEGLQSDARYAESFSRQRLQRGWGPQQIRRDLRERGLDEGQIEAAFARLEVDWKCVAKEIYHKKFGRVPIAGLKDRARRLRFMQYRGFGGAELRGLLESDGGDC